MDTTSTELKYRPATLDDKAVVIEITKAVFCDEAAHHLVELLLRALDGEPGESIHIAECEQHGIVGYLNLRSGGRCIHLDLIAVRPELQRQGFGRQMMDWLIGMARASGFKKLKLNCRGNERAQFLYRRIGFIDLGKSDDAYADGVDCLMMEYDLTNSVTSTNGACYTKQAPALCEGTTMDQQLDTAALIPFLCTDADGNMMVKRAPADGWVVRLKQQPGTRSQVVLLTCDWAATLAWLESCGFQQQGLPDSLMVRSFGRGDGPERETATVDPVGNGKEFCNCEQFCVCVLDDEQPAQQS